MTRTQDLMIVGISRLVSSRYSSKLPPKSLGWPCNRGVFPIRLLFKKSRMYSVQHILLINHTSYLLSSRFLWSGKQSPKKIVNLQCSRIFKTAFTVKNSSNYRAHEFSDITAQKFVKTQCSRIVWVFSVKNSSNHNVKELSAFTAKNCQIALLRNFLRLLQKIRQTTKFTSLSDKKNICTFDWRLVAAKE